MDSTTKLIFALLTLLLIVSCTEKPTTPAFDRLSIQEGDDPMKGVSTAPVTVIEYSDFQCPYCGKFETETFPLIERDYIKTGKVKWYFRQFPLQFHENAQKSAEASECAYEQDKFWEYHDKLYANQDTLDINHLKQFAQDLNLDMTKFNECLDSGAQASAISDEAAEGARLGVSGTPAFFVNGLKIVGAQPFKDTIDSELAAK